MPKGMPPKGMPGEMPPGMMPKANPNRPPKKGGSTKGAVPPQFRKKK